MNNFTSSKVITITEEISPRPQVTTEREGKEAQSGLRCLHSDHITKVNSRLQSRQIRKRNKNENVKLSKSETGVYTTFQDNPK
jgi:hypothetical protein